MREVKMDEATNKSKADGTDQPTDSAVADAALAESAAADALVLAASRRSTRRSFTAAALAAAAGYGVYVGFHYWPSGRDRRGFCGDDGAGADARQQVAISEQADAAARGIVQEPVECVTAPGRCRVGRVIEGEDGDDDERQKQKGDEQNHVAGGGGAQPGAFQ